jgi:predicted GIY-YIG superfamily endonuclease
MEDRKKRIYTIYAIRCKATGRIYIGCTAFLQTRVHQHILELRRHEKIKVSGGGKRKTGVEWQEDFDKHGEESFELYVLEDNVAYKDRLVRETHWIEEYDTMNPAKGYNTMPSWQAKHDIMAGLPPKMTGLPPKMNAG